MAGMTGRGEVGELTVVVEELFDEVDVCQDHSTAAIALELKLVEGLAERGQDGLRRERTGK